MAITLFCVWIKMFKFINFSRTMTQISATLSSSAKDLFGFSIMFFIVFLSFAQLGYLVFGTEVESYSSFDVALFSQFRILLGDFQFDELQNANRVLGPAYFVLYVFFVFFILLNMFLAIINDAYAEVKADMSRQKSEFEMIDFFKKRAEKLFEKIRLKREKSATSQDSSTNMAHCQPTDYEQWRSERLREGYTEAQIGSVLARYDVDGNRSVGRAELRKMHADLGRQKFVEKEDSDSLDLSDDDDDSIMTKSEVHGGGGGGGGRVRRTCGGNGRGSSGGRGVTHEEFSMLQRRVDRMEHSIGSIVSKIDAVLVKLEAIEQTKARRRETVGRLLDSIAESEGVTDESKRQHMEQLVRDELERWDSVSCISGSSPFDPSPASSNSGHGSGRARQEATQEFFSSSTA
jgi:polycystin 2